MTSIKFIDHFRELASEVDIVLSDIWGVLHDGLTAFPDACQALQTFRTRGGTVILITNAPRPADSVQRQLRRLGVVDEAYDAIVSSGDLTRDFLTDHREHSIFKIGPERDDSTFRDLDVVFSPLERADYIICTGLFDDETETPDDYRDMMMKALERKLTLICANPDIVVERGDRLVYCAGAIAELYRSLGGDVIFYGKPHRPIYDRALSIVHSLGKNMTGRLLAIGDSIRTDLIGANAYGIDCLFVTRGLHADEFQGLNRFDDDAAKKFFGKTKPPRALIHELRW